MGGLNAPFTHLAKLGVGAELGTTMGEAAVATASEAIATPVGMIYSFMEN
jgi:hypothetical protein